MFGFIERRTWIAGESGRRWGGMANHGTKSLRRNEKVGPEPRWGQLGQGKGCRWWQHSP